METLYKVITKTDPYHARRYPGFNRDGVCVEEYSLYREQALIKLLNILSTALNESFTCWDDLMLYEIEHQNEIDVFEYSDGSVAVVYDIFTYEMIKMEEK